MKKIFLFLTASLLLLFLSFSNTYSQVEVHKVINDSAYTFGAASPLPNGFFIVAGEKVNATLDTLHVMLYKISPDGQMEWSKNIRLNDTVINGYPFVNAVKPTLDGGFLIGGFYFNLVSFSSTAFLIKTDGAANVEWCKIYGLSNNDMGIVNFVQAADSNYYAVGSYSYPGGNTCFVTKIRANGSVDWIRIAYFTQVSGPYSITLSPDQQLYIGGSVFPVFISKMDTSGAEIWNKSFDPSNGQSSLLPTIHATPDNGLVVLSNNTLETNLDIMKLDSSGTVSYYKSFDFDSCGFNELYGINLLSNEDVMFHGRGYFQNQHYMLGKFNAAGNLLWCNDTHLPIAYPRGFSTSQNRVLLHGTTAYPGVYFSVRDTSSSAGCFATGLNYSFTTPQVSVNSFSPVYNTIGAAQRFVACTVTSETIPDSSMCNTSGIVSVPHNSFSYLIYPNPTEGKFSVFLLENTTGEIRITLTDLAGRIAIKTVHNILPGENVFEIDISFLKKGMYFISMQSTDFNRSQKLIIR